MERLRSEADLDHLTDGQSAPLRAKLNSELERGADTINLVPYFLWTSTTEGDHDQFGHPVGDVSYARSRLRFPQFREIMTPLPFWAAKSCFAT